MLNQISRRWQHLPLAIDANRRKARLGLALLLLVVVAVWALPAAAQDDVSAGG